MAPPPTTVRPWVAATNQITDDTKKYGRDVSHLIAVILLLVPVRETIAEFKENRYTKSLVNPDIYVIFIKIGIPSNQ